MGRLYQLTFPDGKSYIGITEKPITQRLAVHAYRRHHADYAVSKAFRQYGKETVQAVTLVIAEGWSYLCELERKAIAAFGTKYPAGYNMTDGGETPSGLTEESLKKMSDTHKGKTHHTQKHTDEAKQKMSASAIGQKMSPTAKAKISASLIGNTRSLGNVMPLAVRAKIAATNTGRKFSDEHRANISASATIREQRKRNKGDDDGC